MKDLPALTAVRFVAALAVFFYHYARFDISGPPSLQHLVQSGYTGVAFFFVLSGFILTYVSQDVRFSLPSERRKFWMRRVARIYPVYVLAWALFGLGLALQLKFTYFSKILASFGSVALVLLQSWIPRAAENWNWPGWSLSTEAFFYLTFPVWFLQAKKLTKRVLLIVAFLLVVLNAALVSLAASTAPLRILAGTPLEDSLGEFLTVLPVMRWPLFALGVIAGRLYTMGWRSPNWVPVTSAVVAVFALTLSPDSTWVHLNRDAVLAPLFALMILGLADARVRLPRIAIVLGQASYALYILQFPLWQLVWGTSLPGKLWQAWVFLPILVSASVMVYQFVERPAERWIRGRYA
jgi:peptidoglycan/LPS O-acetylase OafA/YrhL